MGEDYREATFNVCHGESLKISAPRTEVPIRLSQSSVGSPHQSFLTVHLVDSNVQSGLRPPTKPTSMRAEQYNVQQEHWTGPALLDRGNPPGGGDM